MSAARALSLAGGLSIAAALAGFTADVSRPIGAELYFPLLDSVGSGHASLALRADYQQHLAMTQRDIGFRHIRGHGSLDDDMSTFLNGHANMYNLFRAFDFYLSVGIRPILELSFMPDELAFDPSKTIMHYRGGTSAPKSLDSWAQFITEVAQLLVERYGVDEVRRWRFEV
jgi:xylan 1,4-beta-xylosidase